MRSNGAFFRRKFIVCFVALTMIVTQFAGMVAFAADGTDITDAFTDPNFKAAVYAAIKKTASEPILDTDVAGITALLAGDMDIENLAGLEYFTALQSLYCYGNRLTELPALPSGLKNLWCDENQLLTLPALPSGLNTLICMNNQIEELPALPSGLATLYCADNQLTELPALPSGLRMLWCDQNRLVALPELPSGLQELWCNFNRLTALPGLPTSLKVLNCNNNQLTELDVTGLPLERLDCSYNYLEDESAVKGFTGTWNGAKYIFSPQNERPLDGLLLTTEAHLVKAGDYFELNAAFTSVISSNAALLTYIFDGERFEYANFTPADGVTVVNTEYEEGQAKITVITMDYDLQNLGDIMLRAKETAVLQNAFETVTLNAVYVVKAEDGGKEIREAEASASFTTRNSNLQGDTNGDGVVDLIDLSNMIDWFGTDNSHSDWDTWYTFFDFNHDGEIGIFDISFVAKII